MALFPISWENEKVKKGAEYVATIISIVGLIIAIISLSQFLESFNEFIEWRLICSQYNQERNEYDVCYEDVLYVPELTSSSFCRNYINITFEYKFSDQEKGYIWIVILAIIDSIAFILTISIYMIKVYRHFFGVCCPCFKILESKFETFSLKFDIFSLPIIIILTILCVILSQTVDSEEFEKTILMKYSLEPELSVPSSNCTFDTGNEPPDLGVYSYYLLYQYIPRGPYYRLNQTKESYDLNQEYWDDISGNLEEAKTIGIPMCILAVISILCSIYVMEIDEREKLSDDKDSMSEKP